MLTGPNLIDTGAIGSASKMPLADTVLQLLPKPGSQRLPLLVVHTHKHLDHRAGDLQFEHIPGVEVVAADLVSVKRFFGFTEWPEAVAHVDLGQRLIDVLPAPGHQDSHIVFYDNNTTLLFSGDFLMPGRLLIEDRRRSARALPGLPAILKSVRSPTSWADTSSSTPTEKRMPLARTIIRTSIGWNCLADLLALPRDLERFRVYQRYPNFILFSANLEIILAWEKWGP